MNYTNDDTSSLDESLERLTRNDPNLTILNLNHVDIGSGRTTLRALATALRNNTHLVVLFLNNNDLSGTSPYFVDLCKSIGRHPTLTFLYMSYNMGMGDAGAIVLAQHALRGGDREGGEEAGKEPLAHDGGIKVLKLAHNNIGPVGAMALAEALKQLQQRQQTSRHADDAVCGCGLQSLVLEQNRLGARGLVELADAMRYNTSLTSLNVRHNQVTSSDGDLQLVQTAFLESLRHDNRTLSELLLLDDLDTDHRGSKVGRELQYHIDRNRLGRRYFGDAAIPATAWTRVLSKAATTAWKTGCEPSLFSGQHQHQQHQVKKNAPSLLPPPPPSLLFTMLRARPDLLQQQQQDQDQSQR